MLKQTIKKLIEKSGLTRLIEPYYTGIGTILCFHRVFPEENNLSLRKKISDSHFTPECLEKIIKFYRKRGYSFISLDDVHDVLQSKGRKERFISFTFDDGYMDTVQYAYPVLKRYDIPFAVYCSSGEPERNLVLWIYLLDLMIFEKEEFTVIIEGVDRFYSCRTLKEKKEVFSRLLSLVLNRPDGHFDILKSLLSPDYTGVSALSPLLMDDQRLREFNEDALVTIGAHTINHFSLSALNIEEARRQMSESKMSLEKRLGHPVSHMAYPYGGPRYAGKREFDLAIECGYKTAVTTRHAHIFPDHSKYPTCLPRVLIGTSACKDSDLLNTYASGFTSLIQNKGKRFITE